MVSDHTQCNLQLLPGDGKQPLVPGSVLFTATLYFANEDIL